MTELLLWVVPILLAIIAYFMKGFVDGVKDLKNAVVQLQIEFGTNNTRHTTIDAKLHEHDNYFEDHEIRLQKHDTEIEVIKEKICK